MRRTIEAPDWLDIHELAAVNIDDRAWLREAACADQPSAIFMPPIQPGITPDFYDAALVCITCPARVSCLATWLAHTAFSVDAQTNCYVGGTTPAQRVVIRRQLKAVPR